MILFAGGKRLRTFVSEDGKLKHACYDKGSTHSF